MNGEDMVNALGYIDEAYIAEAESAKFSAKGHWLKVVGAAACLCLLVGTLYALRSERMPTESMDGKSEISAGGVLEIQNDALPKETGVRTDESKEIIEPSSYQISTEEIKGNIAEIENRIEEIDAKLSSFVSYFDSIKNAVTLVMY